MKACSTELVLRLRSTTSGRTASYSQDGGTNMKQPPRQSRERSLRCDIFPAYFLFVYNGLMILFILLDGGTMPCSCSRVPSLLSTSSSCTWDGTRPLLYSLALSEVGVDTVDGLGSANSLSCRRKILPAALFVPKQGRGDRVGESHQPRVSSRMRAPSGRGDLPFRNRIDRNDPTSQSLMRSNLTKSVIISDKMSPKSHPHKTLHHTRLSPE